jgi:hypothetical protein
MMAYHKNDKRIFNKFNEILELNNEVLVEQYIKRTEQRFYFINSSLGLREILNDTTSYDYLTVYKKKQLPIRRFVDESFKEIILIEYSKMDVTDYSFFDFVFYPKELEAYGAGTDLNDLTEDICEIINDYMNSGLKLCFGQDPRPIYSNVNKDEDDDIIMIKG